MIKYLMDCLERVDREHSYKNIFRVMCGHEDMPAVEWKLKGEKKKITFADQEFAVEYCAGRINELLEGVEKGFVCLKLANCPEWFSIYWGILAAGYKAFLIDARHDRDLTQYFIDESKAVAIVANDGITYEGTKTVNAGDIIKLDRAEIIEIVNKADRTSSSREERLSKYVWGDEVALCTSGTTSTAKIFVYNGESMVQQVLSAECIIKRNEIICDDKPKKNLCFLPLNHIFGYMANYMWYSFFGSSQIMPEKIAPSVLLSTCRDFGVTHILAVPLLANNIAKGIKQKVAKQPKFKQAMFNLMLRISYFCQRINTGFGIKVAKGLFRKSVLSSLAGDTVRCIIIGGGHVLPESMRIINCIGYYTLCGFGMTEVGISSLEMRYNIKYRLMGNVGTPQEKIEYKIIPMDENNANVGELVLRGRSIHSGMLKHGEPAPADLDENGWFKTGDIGRLDSYGALFIEGRLKEVIINESGENVYPDDLENAFLSLENVKTYTVLGVKKPDSSYEDIALVCQVEDGTVESKEALEALREDIAKLNGTLPVYKKINYALVTEDELPLANGIKIKRLIVKRRIENGEGNFVKLDSLK
ncbi:MAG: AMP-binding protein [Clostridia bacterium]|nr:AMP-binding protein [Clostridia bacterium]